MQQDEQASQSILRPLASDTSALYERRAASLKAMLQLAALAVDEHAAKQALNVSSYAYPNDLGRAIGAAADMLRALGVRQDMIERTTSEGKKAYG